MASSGRDDITLLVTDSQYEAIKYPLDPDRILKIIAGPGAGKTRTLVSKIAYSLSQGVTPAEILVLSLTNRAVFALKDQIAQLVGDELACQVNIHTFHSYAISVVSSYYSNDWRLLEDVGWKSLINITSNTTIDEKNAKRYKKLTRKEMERVINLANNGLSNQEISDSFKPLLSISQIENVTEWVHQSKIVTYDNLLKTATDEINKNQDIVCEIKTVIVDEFQDVYGDLLTFIKVIAKSKNLVIAGDPNQSIYGFLGSDPNLIYNFDKEFTDKKSTTIILNECFRSTPEIIRVADAIIQSSTPRVHLKDSGPIPVYKNFNSEVEEYSFIASELNRILSTSDGLVKPNDILILARTNKELDQLKAYLKNEGVETIKLTSVQSWVDSYLFHLVDYLQILNNPESSDHSLMSVLALLDNVGNLTLRNLMKEVSERNASSPAIDQISLWDYLSLRVESYQKNNKLFSPFMKSLYDKREAFDESRENPDKLMKLLLSMADEFGLRKFIMKGFHSSLDAQKYQDYLKGFYDSLCNSYNTKDDGVPLVEHFLRHYNDMPSSQDKNLVNLSTIHSAKGLEFPICFILGKDNPYQFEDAAAERRSLYVAVTRASVLVYYNRLVPSFRTDDILINERILNRYFTTKTPIFNSNFWSQYFKSSGVNVRGVRRYHTNNFQYRFLKSFSHNGIPLRRFLIK